MARKKRKFCGLALHFIAGEQHSIANFCRIVGDGEFKKKACEKGEKDFKQQQERETFDWSQ